MAEHWFIASSEGVSLNVSVQPGASSSSFVRIAEGRLKVRIQAKAVDGAANQALIEFLAEKLNVKRASVTIVRGGASRQKTVMIKGETQKLACVLEALAQDLENTRSL